MPVSSPSTWQDVAASRSLASKDLLPLASGVRHIEIGRIGLSVIEGIYALGGPQGLSVSFSLVQCFALFLFGLAILRVSGNLLFAAVSPVLITAGVFFESSGISRSTFGMLFLSIQFLLLANWRDHQTGIAKWCQVGLLRWGMVIALFNTWANFHASFFIGFLILLAYATAQILKSPENFYRNEEFISRVWLVELAIAATLFTPNGMWLWCSAFWLPDNAIFNQLGGWHATSLAGWHGVVVALSWLVWIVASRFNYRVPVFTTLAAILLTALTAVSTSCILWLLPMMLIAIADLFPPAPAKRKTDATASNPPLKFAYTLIVVLIFWFGFCFSPVGSHSLGKSVRNREQILGDSMPVAATTVLTQSSSDRLLWCPIHWSGFLQVQTRRPLFANSAVYRLPGKVIQDYHGIYNANANWDQLLDQYDVSTVVLDRRHQPELFRQLRIKNNDWSIDYQDPVAVVARRIYP